MKAKPRVLSPTHDDISPILKKNVKRKLLKSINQSRLDPVKLDSVLPSRVFELNKAVVKHSSSIAKKVNKNKKTKDDKALAKPKAQPHQNSKSRTIKANKISSKANMSNIEFSQRRLPISNL